MARSFSSIDEVRRLPDSPEKEILLGDLERKPDDCRGFRDVLECADSMAVLVEPGDDIHRLSEDGGEPRDLTDFERMYYERVEMIAGGRMVVATEVGTSYYIPAGLLSGEELALFRRRAERSWRPGA
jgi:hypothetical protein